MQHEVAHLARNLVDIPLAYVVPDQAMIAQSSDELRHVPDAVSVVALVETTLRDLHPGALEVPPVTLDSVLDRDLGFDSLGRMELLQRMERAFGVELPAETLQRAESVRDLLGAVRRGEARPAPGGGAKLAARPPAAIPRPSDVAHVGAPGDA